MRKTLIAACSAALLLTGCGSSSDETPAPSATPATDPSTEAQAGEGKTDPETFETAIQVLNYLQDQNVTCESTDSIDLGLVCETPSVSYIVNADPTGEQVSSMIGGTAETDNSALIYGDHWYISCVGATAPTACFSAGAALTGYEKAGF